MSQLLFLGGTTSNSTWRDEIIPLLEYEDIAFFNPVVPNWNDEAYEREMFIKSLPSTVELYVITKEMKGPFSVAEAVEASNKKPGQTIFMYDPKGMDSAQIKSMEAVKKLIEANKAYVVNTLSEVVYVFKSICLGFSTDQINSKLSSRRVATGIELASVHDTFKTAEEKLNYETIFSIVGIGDLLEGMFLEIKDLSKEYRDIFFNSLKKFLKNPLYKDLDLNDEADLRFLKSSDPFTDYLDSVSDDIKENLISRQKRVEDFLVKFDPKSEVSLQEVMDENKLDKVSLMFILHELKENKKIYDFNGRNVTLL